jgi:hypothetical protein
MILLADSRHCGDECSRVIGKERGSSAAGKITWSCPCAWSGKLIGSSKGSGRI